MSFPAGTEDRMAFVRWSDAWRRWYETEPPLWRVIRHWKWKRMFPRLRDFLGMDKAEK